MNKTPSADELIDKFSNVFQMIKHENKLYVSLPECIDLDDLKDLPHGVSAHSVDTYSDEDLGAYEKCVLECDLVQLNEDGLKILFNDLNKLR